MNGFVTIKWVKDYFLWYYICRKWHGTPMAREHSELKWVRPLAMRNYPMPEADEPLIAHLCDLL